MHPRRLRKQAEKYEENEEYGAFQTDRRANGRHRLRGSSLHHIARHRGHGWLPVLTPRNHSRWTGTTPVAKILRIRANTAAVRVFLTQGRQNRLWKRNRPSHHVTRVGLKPVRDRSIETRTYITLVIPITGASP